MQAIGKIGVVIPLVSAAQESNLLEGIHRTARRMGYDVLVFTNSSNSQNGDIESDAVNGEEAIYTLLDHVKLDGVLLCAGRFQSQAVKEHLAEQLKALGIPALAIEWEGGPLPSYTLSERSAFRAMTSHLIEEHGLRRIYCLTGPEGIFESHDRLAGWEDALREHGIEPEADWIFYGDFWKVRPQVFAEAIASGALKRPEAVVCANDVMAGSLCEAFQRHGLRVPEDIAVTGFDGDLSGELSNPSITTVSGRNFQFGANAVGRLLVMMTGIPYQPEPDKVRLTIRHSCGCSREERNFANERYYDWLFRRNEYKQVYMNCNYEMDLFTADSLEELSNRISRYTFLILNQNQFDICLCEPWCGELGKPQQGSLSFSRKMRHFFTQAETARRPEREYFPLEQLLPMLHQPHEPVFAVFQPLHFKGNMFGYISLQYPNGGDYFMDEHFLRWRNAMSNALVVLREKLNTQYIAAQLEELSVREPVSGMYNRKGFQLHAEEFLSRLREPEAGLMLISWDHVSAATFASGEKISLLFAHALQMLCGSDSLPARLHARTFLILFPITEELALEEFETALLFRIEYTLRTLQQRSDAERPDLIAVTERFSPAEGLPDLEELSQRLSQKLAQNSRQHINFAAELKAIRRQIATTPESAPNVGEAAALLGISEGYFLRLFKTQFEVPYNEEVIQSKLRKAKLLLRDTNFSIKEIADRCGYTSASHFMRQFKARAGVTAMEYRKSHAKPKEE